MSAQAMRYWILLGIVAVFFAVFSFTINNFASPMTVTNLIRQSAVFTILSIGMTLVIIVGELISRWERTSRSAELWRL